MKEKLSALVDGEFQDNDLRTHLARIKSDAELRTAWNTYHLIGDALRGHVCPDLTSRVVARLLAEPTLLAPQRPQSSPRRLGWIAMSGASLAAVTLVVWTASPIWRSEPQLAGNPASVEMAGAGDGPVSTVSLPATDPGSLVSAAEFENYLLAHQPYSHSSAMGAPYARTVADDRGVGKK